MERASGRSYSGGPLSKVAQKVLAALQAQSRSQARRHQSSSGDHSQMERYGSSQWEASGWSYEDRFADGPSSRPRVSSHSTSHCRSSTEQQSAQTSACYQYWQTPASSLSSQPPSSSSCCRDLSPQRQTSRAEAHYRSSQTHSSRRRSASQPPSFSQGEAASSFCHGDRAPLFLPTPRTTLLHEAASWRNFAEDVTPSFTVNTSPDEDSPDEMIHITNPHLPHDEDPFIIPHPVTSSLGVYDETDGNAHKEKTSQNWNFHRNGLNHIVASGSQLKRKQSLDASYEKANFPGGLHLYPSSFATRQEYSYDPCSPKLKRHTTRIAQVDLQHRTVAGSGQPLNRQHVNIVGCHTAGKKLVNVEQKDHGPDHKIVLMGLDCDSPGNSPIFSQRGHQRISVCRAVDRHERAELDHLRGQCEPITSVQGGSSREDLERERVMERRSENETQNKTKMGTDTGTDHKIEAVDLQSSGTNLKPCETNRDTDPGEKKEDAEPPVTSETKRKCAEDSGRANRPAPALSREPRRSRFMPSRLRGNQQITSGRTRGRSSNLPATTASAPEQNSSTVPGEKLENINVPAPENQCCHLSLNSTSSLKRRHAASPPSNTGLAAKSSRGFPAGGHARGPQTTTAALTCDPRVKDSGKLNSYEKTLLLEKAGRVQALLLTLVYQDGTTQLDAEQKLPPPACGLLVLMKSHLTSGVPRDSPAPDDSLVYLKLELTPAWAQQQMHQSQQLYTRDLLLQVLSSPQLVVCYKAKDLLRTVLQFYTKDLSWTKVAGCRIQDPQVSGWLLDPADSSSCFQDLLNKHCKQPRNTPAVGTQKVSQVISGLYSLFSLHMELSSRLQSQGLWELYSDLELNMIPVLAAMESHHIHVDKDALKRTSDLLGTRMKELEQEAHREAGQTFLVTSSSQLRMVLFEKLRLHERCENKRLPKTVNKQQQSTSEAALLQLQDLHPLPKVILEYRRLHKIKSTFVDGILSCMTNKNYISSTWLQTSAVTGRISAKHPNFQALPRQPVQITKKQHVQGKGAEVVTVHPRSMFIPPEGWSFLAADFCQVELRLLAHLSADPELLRIFTSPQADVFTMLASQWKGVSEDEVTTKDREHAKRIVYSVVYGAGRERLSEILGVSVEQAGQFQDSFLQTYREVQAFIQKTIQQSRKQGYVLSIMGRRRALPNIGCPVWGVRMQAERQAVNFVVQGSAADLCKTAMIRIFNLVSSSSSSSSSSSGPLSARLIAQLHDELLFEVEDSQVERFAALVKRTMESLQHIHHLGVHLKVPLKVAVSSGKSWGSMSKLNILSP